LKPQNNFWIFLGIVGGLERVVRIYQHDLCVIIKETKPKLIERVKTVFSWGP